MSDTPDTADKVPIPSGLEPLLPANATPAEVFPALWAALEAGRLAPEQGAALVPFLVRFHVGADPVVRRQAHFLLGELDPAAEQAAPADARYYVCELHNPEGERRENAARRIGHHGHAAEFAIPALAAALRDPVEDVRVAAAFALGSVGPAAIPALIEALALPDADAPRAAARSLGDSGPAAAAAVPALYALLRRPETALYTGQAALNALKKIRLGADARGVIE